MISESDKNLDFIISVFRMKLMCLLGFMPTIDKCVGCGEETENLTYFSLAQSGLKCDACSKQDKGAVNLSASTITAIKYIIMAPPKKLFSFNISDDSINELNIVTKLYLNDKLDKEYKFMI